MLIMSVAESTAMIYESRAGRKINLDSTDIRQRRLLLKAVKTREDEA